MPTGESVPIGASTSLDALKGQVTGNNVVRSLAVRSLAGLGEASAMLVRQNNVGAAVSESDLIRQRAAENIGNSADQQATSFLTTQHVVVSISAVADLLIFIKPHGVSSTAAQTVNVSASTKP